MMPRPRVSGLIIGCLMVHGAGTAAQAAGPPASEPAPAATARAQVTTFWGRITTVFHHAELPAVEIVDVKGREQTVSVQPITAIIDRGKRASVQALQPGQWVEVSREAWEDHAITRCIKIMPTPQPDPDGLRATIQPDAAAEATEPVEPEPERYGPGQKLARGLLNATTGLLEVPKSIWLTSHDHNALVGWTMGLLDGVTRAGVRMLTGAYDAVTFPLPMPTRYRPVIQPEFVWEVHGVSIFELRNLTIGWDEE